MWDHNNLVSYVTVTKFNHKIVELFLCYYFNILHTILLHNVCWVKKYVITINISAIRVSPLQYHFISYILLSVVLLATRYKDIALDPYFKFYKRKWHFIAVLIKIFTIIKYLYFVQPFSFAIFKKYVQYVLTSL